MSMSLQLPPNDEGFSVETREAPPSDFLMKIESFSLLSEYGIGEYESREFEGGDFKWKLMIYLDGLESEEESDSDHVCVFVAAAGTSSLPMNWEINAIFTIFLYNQISDNYLCFRGKPRRFHEMKPKWGFTKLISKEFLTDPRNGYVVEDTCVFGAEVFVTKTPRVIERLSLLKETSRTTYNPEWEISHCSKLEGRVWFSKDFTVEDYRWKVMLYPKGNAHTKGGYVSISLQCVDSKSFAPHQKVLAEFSIFIKNMHNHTRQHQSSYLASHWFTSSDDSWEYEEYLALADMRDPSKGFVVDDRCILEIEISVQAVVSDDEAPKI
ncbi:hypothetical protein C2S51_001560 [Perilla frutescens var. frutescens]|nr:hypothetical protein C2S51_001560 [Perilla frutescens var. frutescens]